MMNHPILLFLFCYLASIEVAFAQETTYFCPPCGASCDTITYKKPGRCSHCNMELVANTKEAQMTMLEKQKQGRRRIAVYIHEGMEILDFAGPVEVFTHTGFEVYTVGVTKEPIVSQGVVKITPEYTIDNCPQPDIIAFFGGNAARAAQNGKVIDWLKNNESKTELIFSVCTGAFFLAKAGLLDGKKATTFHDAIESLQKEAPKAMIVEGVKYVDAGKIVTSAGVSSGIDGALYVVSRLMNQEVAEATARYMEFNWTKSAQLESGKNK